MTDTILINDIRIEPDGGLRSSWDYLDYVAGQGDAVFDGTFDVAELRAIADHIEKHQK